MFSISSLTGFGIITRNVWLVYSQPAIFRYTKDSDIPGSIEVSMQTKFTLNTLKRIAFAISLVDMSAVRTFLTGISRINGNNRFTNCFSFVSQKLFKLVKTPVIKLSGKFNSSGSTLNSYACQIFNSIHVIEQSHKFLRDVMIHPGYKPFFFSA